MLIKTENINIINMQKSILYEYVDFKAFPLESTGLLFRGIGEKELNFIRQHNCIASKGKGNDADQDCITCFSQLFSQAEGYARSNYDLYNEKQAYVIGVMPPGNEYENDLGEIEVVGPIPASNIVVVMPIDQLEKAITRSDAKNVHKTLPEGGVWRTMNGHHIYVKDGKVLAGAVPAVKGGAKKATKSQLAEHQARIDKQEAALKSKKKKVPAAKPKASEAKKPAAKKLTKKQLFAAIDKTEPYKKYKPTQTEVDWGTGRGQGKRRGKMVTGSMSDAPKGKKVYTNLVGGVPDYEEHKVDFTNMTDRDKLDYLKAREYGLNHEQAMIYQIANSGKHDLDDKKIMERINHFADKPAEKAAAGRVMTKQDLKPKASEAKKKAEPKVVVADKKKPAPKATSKATKAKEEAAAARKAIDDIANSKPKEPKKKAPSAKTAKKAIEEATKKPNPKTKPGKAATKKDLDKLVEENKKRPASKAKGATKKDIDSMVEAAPKKTTPKPPTKEDLDEMFGKPKTASKKGKKTKEVADIRSEKQENHDIAYDVGNKIGGARKDTARIKAATDKLLSDSTGQSLDELEAMAPELAQKYCIKKNLINPVDFKAEFDRGADINMAMCKQLIYDRIAPKPKGDTPEDRRQYLSAIRSLERILEPIKSWDDMKKTIYDLRPRMKRELPGATSDQERYLDYAKKQAAKEPTESDLRQYNSKESKWETITPKEWKAKKAARVKEVEAEMQKIKDAKKEPFAPLGDKILNFFTDADSANRTLKTIYSKKLDWNNYFKKAEEDPGKADQPKVNKNKLKWERIMPTKVTRSGGRKTPVSKPEDMIKTFKFRGVEFGNWVDDASGNFHLVKCAEAFQDLADILGMKDKDVSLNGSLAMAFGARGKGAALAHYEPVAKAINITKNGGAGTLAHEWGHALDNMMYQESVGRSSLNYGSEGLGEQGSPEVRAAYKDVMHAIMFGDGKGLDSVENKHKTYYTYHPQFKKAVEAQGLSGAVKFATEFINDKYARNREHLNGLRERGIYNEATIQKRIDSEERKRKRDISDMVQEMAYHHEKLTGQKLDEIPIYTGHSQYYVDSGKQGGKDNKYWTSGREMFARAFENYVEGKMKTGPIKNDYLVAGTYSGGIPGMKPPYPQGEERDNIHKAFDKLIAAIKKSGAIQKALEIMELQKSMDKGSSDEYVRRMLVAKHREKYEYPENGPEYVTSARHDDTWCQIWALGMDWNCYYYMLNSKDKEPVLAAFIDDSDNKFVTYSKYVPEDIKRGYKAWQAVCENWVNAHDKRLQKGNLGQELEGSYVDQLNRNAYNVPDPAEVIWIPVNRLSCPYQTEEALNFDKIQENVEHMKNGDFLDPVVIGYNYDVHDGHHRIEASKIMNYTHIPCVVGGSNELEVQRAKEAYSEVWKSLETDIAKDIESEKQAILDYKETIKDIKDPKIRKIIAEILADEKNHKYNLKQIVAYLKGDKEALNEDKLQS